MRETQTVGTLGVMDDITFQGDRSYKALLDRYESKSTTKCIECLKELLHMELKPKETVPQTVGGINETYAILDDALSVQGQSLVELIKIVALLTALSDTEYEVTRTVAESDVQVTFEKTVALLRHTNERITSTMASKTSAAYYTTSKDKSTCDHCHKSNLSAECWKEYPHLNPFLKKEKAREEEKRKKRTKRKAI